MEFRGWVIFHAKTRTCRYLAEGDCRIGMPEVDRFRTASANATPVANFVISGPTCDRLGGSSSDCYGARGAWRIEDRSGPLPSVNGTSPPDHACGDPFADELV